jgi:catechol 2,3-dioxygenase-like lactoylglutathione lyase family enzyme
MPYSSGFDHVATLTPDLDRFADWYGTVFGAEVTFRMDAKEGHPKMYILDMGGGAALNVFEVPESEILGDRRRQGGRGGIDHYGIAVRNRAELEATRERLVSVGADIGEIQQLGDCWSLFFRDVDGMELEVCSPLD